MINVGEQIVSSFLRYIRSCEFIHTNLNTEPQGEIDVVGINLKEKKVYVCEVAVHLQTGLRYPNNVEKLTEKFARDIAYAKKYLNEYTQHFMLWCPIVKSGKRSPENDQLQHVKQIAKTIKAEHDVEIEAVINDKFQSYLTEMRDYAKAHKPEFKCPVMRLFQIEGCLSKHLDSAV